MIKIEHIKKAFPGKPVLNDIELTAQNGAIHVLFGKNGCGKTTLIKIMADLLRPDSGTVFIDDTAVGGEEYRYKAETGWVFDKPLLVNQLKVRQFMQLSMVLQNMNPKEHKNRVAEICGLLSIPQNQRIETLSKGQRMKTAVAVSLLHQPGNLIWDEPFEGVDLESLRTILTILEKKRDNGACIFLATHRTDIIRRLADTIFIVEDGVISRTLDKNDFRAGDYVDENIKFENQLTGENVGQATQHIPEWIYSKKA